MKNKELVTQIGIVFTLRFDPDWEIEFRLYHDGRIVWSPEYPDLPNTLEDLISAVEENTTYIKSKYVARKGFDVVITSLFHAEIKLNFGDKSALLRELRQLRAFVKNTTRK